MSIEAPTTKAEFIQHVKVLLGEPVVRVNVSPEQVAAVVKQAVYKFSEYHYDATEKVLVAQQVMEEDKARGYFTTDEKVVRVTRVFSSEGVFGANSGGLYVPGSSMSVFTNPLFQVARNLSEFDTQVSPVMQFYMAKSYLANVENTLTAEDEFSWSPVTRRLRTFGTQSKHVVGNYLLYEAFVVLDDEPSEFWSNDWLLRYTAALMQVQWGRNLTKYKTLALPGGIEVNGEQIENEGRERVKELDEELLSRWTAYPAIMVG